jgi:uncharacterized protein (TIGR03435 family)
MMFSREVRTLTLAIGATLAGGPPSIRAQSQQALTQSVAVPTAHFEVASIKLCKEGGRHVSSGGGTSSPGRLSVDCTTLGTSPDSFPGLLQQAYGLFANGRVSPLWAVPKIEGGPAWLTSERYEIDAKAEGNASPEMMMGPMMQTLLEDRFKLKIHRETREVPVYALRVAKGGPKLTPFQEGSCTPSTSAEAPPVRGKPPVCKTFASSKGSNLMILQGQGLTLDEFSGVVLAASALGFKFDRPVINRTGIVGRFDFHLEFAIDDLLVAAPSGAAGPSIFTAIQQQLGLRIEPTKGPSEVLVIDHVEKPSEN